MLSNELMGLLALAIVWVNTLLVVAAAGRELSALAAQRRWMRPLAPGEVGAGLVEGVVASVADGAGAHARHHGDQVGRQRKVLGGVASDDQRQNGGSISAAHGADGKGVGTVYQRYAVRAGDRVREDRAARIAVDVNTGIQRPAGSGIRHNAGDGGGGRRSESEILRGGAGRRYHDGRCVAGNITILGGGHAIGASHQGQRIVTSGVGNSGVSARGFHGCAGQRGRGAIGHSAGENAGGFSGAGGELEGTDAGLPGGIAGGLNVFLGIPESTAIGIIHSHHAVIAPAGGSVGLGTGAGDQDGFALRQGVRGIGIETPGVAD